MAERFEINELVHLFRSAILALLPTMDAALIPWKEPHVYDPWEDIERTLYESIINSCIENAKPSPLKSLVKYDLHSQNYSNYSFISDKKLREQGISNAFLSLKTKSEPFDTAIFLELNTDWSATGKEIPIPITECGFELAARSDDGIIYRKDIEYLN